jgi:hypothetical protein
MDRWQGLLGLSTALVAGALAVACGGEDDSSLLAGAGAAGTGGTDGSELPSCTIDPPSALAFDGMDDHVTMREAPALGLEHFTIEAWIRRDGYGQAAPSGDFSIVPIAGKGSCKTDEATVDCNYTLGLRGDLLFADFEQDDDGTNHPIVGRVVIPWDEWHHVAASYDGTWRLYVDGVLDTEAAVNATPRFDTTQHFAIGTAYDAADQPEGRFHGAIAEVRVWDHARTGDEIAASMSIPLADAEGLIGRWSLDREDQGDDSTGTSPGEVSGALTDSDGPSLGEGSAPEITMLDSDVVAGTLSVKVSDAEDDPMKVTFHVREVTDADDFTIVVLPDTQYYTDVSRNTAHFFYEQTAWILENREALNIVAVIHNGDIVEHGNRDAGAWVRTETAMEPLEAALPGLPHGLPYGMTVGNHDQTPAGSPGGTASYNSYFGIGRFRNREYYGGHYGGRNDEHWFTFNVGGLSFAVVSIQYRTSNDPAVVAWMRSLFEANPRLFGIVNSHYIVSKSGTFGTQGAGLYQAVKDVDNVQLMTCGHVCVDGIAESRRTDDFEGNVIHSMLADYQCIGYQPPPGGGGQGYLRIWQLSPKRGEIHVRTYSPSLDVEQHTRQGEFTLPVDLRGAGAPFEKLASVDPIAGTATATVSDLAPGKTYEWTATVRDCTHFTKTSIGRFTTR